MPEKKKVFLTDPNWRVFEISWTPKDYGEIKKKKISKFLAEHQDGWFMNILSLSNGTLTFRIKATKKEKESISSPVFIGRILTRAQKTLSGEKMGFIDADTHIREEDCSIKILYVFIISGDNLLYPVKRIGTSEKKVLLALNPGREIVNMKVSKEELKGTSAEFAPTLRSCKKNICWKKEFPIAKAIEEEMREHQEKKASNANTPAKKGRKKERYAIPGQGNLDL
ncbi:MAG TPA: hypothetical protein P5096_03660 [Patescibacteria group bacterium]|nr:hypothetical protein [Patescibacteria group bacterium]